MTPRQAAPAPPHDISRGVRAAGRALHSAMNGPIAALTVLAAMGGYTVVRFATTLPDPGDPGFPTVLAMVAAFAGGAWHLAVKRTWAGIQLQAFKFAFVATGLGIAAYALGLITGLY